MHGCWSQIHTKTRKKIHIHMHMMHLKEKLRTTHFRHVCAGRLPWRKSAGSAPGPPHDIWRLYVWSPWKDIAEECYTVSTSSVINRSKCSHVLYKWSTDRRQLTAISWASLVAAVSTSNSCISTVGRKLMITWVSMACRHYLKYNKGKQSK